LISLLTDLLGEEYAQALIRLLFAAIILLAVYALRKFEAELRDLIGRMLHPLAIWVRDKLSRTHPTKRRSFEQEETSKERELIVIDAYMVRALAGPVDLFFSTLGVWIAIAIGFYSLPGISPAIIAIINAIGKTVIAAACFWALIKLVDALGHYLNLIKARFPGLDSNVIRLGTTLAKIVLLLFSVVVIAEQWGYNLAVVFTSVGLVGLALSLAAQDTAANFIGYFAILSDHLLKPGDFVTIGSFSGSVESIGFRSTRFRTPDKSLVIMPNSEIAKATITNWAGLESRRLNMTLNLYSDTPAEKVLAVVEDTRIMLQGLEHFIEGSAIVQFTGFGDYSLDVLVIATFAIPGWAEFQALKEQVNVAIMDILTRHGVSLAVPQRVTFNDIELGKANLIPPPNDQESKEI
jgi:MscS family membrane protein